MRIDERHSAGPRYLIDLDRDEAFSLRRFLAWALGWPDPNAPDQDLADNLRHRLEQVLER